MLNIRKPIITYKDPDSLLERSHHVLVADYNKKHVLISHANLYLSDAASSSLETSNRYSDVIAQFYKYLSTQPKFNNYDISQYHVIADNRDIRRWQVQRQIDREKAQKLSPSSETIYRDAKQLLLFFLWLKDNGYVTNVKVKIKSWMANFKSDRLLNYISSKARTKIDSSNIKVLDKKGRQKKLKSLITNMEVQWLLNSYPDPVYSTMFKVALDTAMRPMDIVKFPYVGSGKNMHIMPYSEMGSPKGEIHYFVDSSKRNKDRTIRISSNVLKIIEDEYINVHYENRKKLYKEKNKRNCPPSILFLNKAGEPITSAMISNRTNYAVGKARRNYPEMREGVDFYQARHWWPTYFILSLYKEDILSTAPDVIHAAAAQVLTEQMGHEDISTTFKYYVDRARIIAQANFGRLSEVMNEVESIRDFVSRIEENKKNLY